MTRLQQALKCCKIYPDKTERVDLIETHISWLYLTATRVYKIKKPVDFGFCNFTSLERRRHYCEEEVRLNRRLADQTYLGVSKIVIDGESFAIDRPGEVCEYAVRMARLPTERMLNRRLDEDPPTEDLGAWVEKIGQLLARFHSGAEQIESTTHDHFHILTANWQQNFDQTRDRAAEVITPRSFALLERLITSYLARNRKLFEERQTLGLVRDGHGDLHCEHICLADPLQIFDCIEFNPALRYDDILCDLAFLYMDLQFRDRADLARTLWETYRNRIDPGPQAETLLNFYALYRAWVRAKVHLFQTRLAGNWAQHLHTARNYFRLAAGYALPQILLLCCGLIGSGKSTLAADLGKALKIKVLSSDRLRPAPATGENETCSYGEGRYSGANRLAVYRRLAIHAESELSKGHSLIIDATFENEQMREILLSLASRQGVACCFIEVRCDRTLIRKRLSRRQRGSAERTGSEAGIIHFERQLRHYSPLSPELESLQVDSGQPRENNVDFVIDRLLQNHGKLR